MKSSAIDSAVGNTSIEASDDTGNNKTDNVPKIRGSEEFKREFDNIDKGLSSRERLAQEKKMSEGRVSEISEYLNKNPACPEYSELLKELEDVKSSLQEFESMESLSDDILNEYYSEEDSADEEEDEEDYGEEDDSFEDEEDDSFEDEEDGKFAETMTIIDAEDIGIISAAFDGIKESDLSGFLKALGKLILSLDFWEIANEILDNRLKEFQGLVKGVPVEIPFDLDKVIGESVNKMIGSILNDSPNSSSNNRGESINQSENNNEEKLTAEELEKVKKYVGVLDDVSYSDLKWEFGGFNGTEAEAYGVMIGDLEMDKNGLSFEYDLDLSNWGVEDDDDSGQALACMFVLDNDGQWVGGKFEWISTSRETRSFTNINAAYKGWDLSNVPSTTTAAFVIVSADGKRRSNVITAIWER